MVSTDCMPLERIAMKRGAALMALFCITSFHTPASTFQVARTSPDPQVIMDPYSFGPSDTVALQAESEQISVAVDRLIPGHPKSLNAPYVMSFRIPAYWPQQVPITIAEERIAPGEPTAIRPGDTRIGLAVHGNYPQQLAFQLAHELAHVKMGPHRTSPVLEAFATAVSLEVVKEFGFGDYYSNEVRTGLASLPADVRDNALHGDQKMAAEYWAKTAKNAKYDGIGTDMEILGAVLLKKSIEPNWKYLLNIEDRLHECENPKPTVIFRRCSVAFAKPGHLRPALIALGL